LRFLTPVGYSPIRWQVGPVLNWDLLQHPYYWLFWRVSQLSSRFVSGQHMIQ
jgi:hypothetical protein